MAVSTSPAGAESRSETGTSDSNGLVSKSRGTKSAVCTYFGFKTDEEGRLKVQDAMICWLCKKSVSAQGGKTSNPLSHLKVHHPQRHFKVKKANSKPSGKDKDHTKLASLLSGNRPYLTHFHQARSMNERAESGSMHIPVYRDVTVISNTNIEFPILPQHY